MKSTKNQSKQSEKLFNAITDIREDYILEATEHEFKQAAAKKPWTARRTFRYAGPIAAALCLSLLMGIFFWPAPVATSAYTIVEAAYPGMAAYPNEADYYNESGDFELLRCRSYGGRKRYNRWSDLYLQSPIRILFYGGRQQGY